MTVRVEASVNRIGRRIVDIIKAWGWVDPTQSLAGPINAEFGIDLSTWAGSLPCALVVPGAVTDGGDGHGYDTNRGIGEMLIHLATADPAAPWAAAWNLESDVRAALTLDRQLSGLLENGYIIWRRSEVGADPKSREGFSVINMTFEFNYLWLHANP